jgi:hypothetical protein
LELAENNPRLLSTMPDPPQNSSKDVSRETSSLKLRFLPRQPGSVARRHCA